MPFHDAHARITPFELAFPDRDAAESIFREIEEEVEAREVDPSDPDRFVLLMAVGKALRELRGPGEDPDRIRDHGVLLYHAWHAWRAGDPVFLLTTHAVRYLVEAGDGAGPATLPADAGYLQLPQHLVWMRGGPEETPESVDGVAWTRAGGRLSVLVATGIRGDRPGLSVVALPPAPLDEWGRWLREPGRPDGEDFATDIPGAELERLYEVRTAGEVLKLVARALDYIRATPEATERRSAPAPADDAGPRPSTLPYARVTLP